MGGLYAITEWITRFSITNILWIIINLPILLIIGSILFIPSDIAMAVQVVPMVILLPIIFFPSTTAVFASVRDWTMNKEQTSVIKMYFQHLKENYKKSFPSGLVLTCLWVVWVVDSYYFQKQSVWLALIMFVVGLILFVYTINFFNLSVHYMMSKKELFKNALLVTIGNPLLFLSILIVNFSLFYLSVIKIWFLFPFFTISVSAFLSFLAFYRFALKVERKAGVNK
jgi:uncharacterized membrane protein YesL